jgi:hypothetical protein
MNVLASVAEKGAGFKSLRGDEKLLLAGRLERSLPRSLAPIT